MLSIQASIPATAAKSVAAAGYVFASAMPGFAPLISFLGNRFVGGKMPVITQASSEASDRAAFYALPGVAVRWSAPGDLPLQDQPASVTQDTTYGGG